MSQAELGDIVFVELPEVGDTVTRGEQFGVVESVKVIFASNMSSTLPKISVRALEPSVRKTNLLYFLSLTAT